MGEICATPGESECRDEAGQAAVLPPRSQIRHPRRQGWHGEMPQPARPAVPPDTAFATVIKEKGTLRLLALDESAARLHLKPGMPLADARAMFPALVTAEADLLADAELLAATVAWCRRWTPLTAQDGADGCMLDITGCAHLFGGEAALMFEIRRHLTRQGFRVHLAVASTPGCAYALTRHGKEIVLPAGKERTAVEGLSVSALRLGEAVTEGLCQAGLWRIGDLAERPRAPLAARFGARLLDRLDEALGLAISPIGPRLESAPYMTERRFFEPIATRDDVWRTLVRLAENLCQQLERHGEGARRLELTLFRVDGALRHVAVGTGRPVRDAGTIARLFKERLDVLADALDPGFGFDVVRLCALNVDKQACAQQAMDAADSGAQETVLDLVDRLGARLGWRKVVRLEAQESHIPEFAVMAVPARQGLSGKPGSDHRESAGEPPNRPVRLFQRAEPVEALAAVPDGPPVRFRWRHVLHEVACAEGPERIAPEWWKGQGAMQEGATRDYFRVEDTAGRRFWLYREGLYGVETTRPRWFVQGAFA